MLFVVQNINALVLLSCGTYCAYLGFRGVPAGTARLAEWQQWHFGWGRMMKVAGPIVMLMGAVLSVVVLYLLVRRAFGTVAGLLAALVLAVTPINVVGNHNNTIADGTVRFRGRFVDVVPSDPSIPQYVAAGSVATA